MLFSFIHCIYVNLEYLKYRKLWANNYFVEKGIGKGLSWENTIIFFKRLLSNNLIYFILKLNNIFVAYVWYMVYVWIFHSLLYVSLIYWIPRGVLVPKDSSSLVLNFCYVSRYLKSTFHKNRANLRIDYLKFPYINNSNATAT